MKKLVLRFLNEESGATAIEYGLIAAHPDSNHSGRQWSRHEIEHDVHQHFEPAEVEPRPAPRRKDFCPRRLLVSPDAG
jgi:Flp/Fap pilin component